MAVGKSLSFRFEIRGTVRSVRRVDGKKGRSGGWWVTVSTVGDTPELWVSDLSPELAAVVREMVPGSAFVGRGDLVPELHVRGEWARRSYGLFLQAVELSESRG